MGISAVCHVPPERKESSHFWMHLCQTRQDRRGFPHFQELPDHWSVQNVERACKEVLPGLLTEEELKIVPDILTHYLDVVGEAELIPNYIHLQKCVTESYS